MGSAGRAIGGAAGAWPPANAAAGQRTSQNASTTDRFNAGDFVLLGVGQDSGGDLQLQASQKQIHLAVTYVGP